MDTSAKRCLFLIDVQSGFVEPGTTQPVIPHLEQLARDFEGEFVPATKFVNRDGSGFTDIMGWHGLKDERETALLPFVEDRADYIIEKNTYSACTDEAMQILRGAAITEVVLAGIDTDCCVLATAISLFEHNIRPLVLEKYCASTGGAASHAAGIRVLDRLIGAAQITNGTYPHCMGRA